MRDFAYVAVLAYVCIVAVIAVLADRAKVPSRPAAATPTAPADEVEDVAREVGVLRESLAHDLEEMRARLLAEAGLPVGWSTCPDRIPDDIWPGSAA